MIKINLNHKELYSFYEKEIIPAIRCIDKTSNQCFDKIFLKFVKAHLKKDDCLDWNEFIHDLLLLSPINLFKKYSFISEFCRFVLFCHVYSDSKKIKQFCSNFLKIYSSNNLDSILVKDSFLKSIRQEINSNYIYIYISRKIIKNNYLKKDTLDLHSLVTYMNQFYTEAQRINFYLNNKIKNIIGYSILESKDLRKKLYKLFNIRICPYCNQQYIFSVNKNSYLGDFDHFIPKAIFPLFALSLWNLVPCCKTCNQVFKGQKLLAILNPHFKGFDDNFGLNIDYQDVKSIIGLSLNFDVHFTWFAPPLSNKANIPPVSPIKLFYEALFMEHSDCIEENNVTCFELDEIYSNHKEEISEFLRKKNMLFDLELFEKCSKNLKNNCLLYDLLSEEKLLFGVSLDSNKFQNEILSKALYDVFFKN